MNYQIAPERRLIYRVLVFIFALAAAWFFGWMAVSAPHGGPEASTEDAVMRLSPATPRPDVVLVALDQPSVTKYGPVADLPRSVLAAALQNVESGGPKTVVMDLALDQRTNTGDPALWKTIANHKNVVLGMTYDAERQPPYTADDVRAWRFLEKDAYTSAITFGPQTQVFPFLDFEPPVSDFTGSAQGVGVFDRETDPDGIVRSVRMFYLTKTQSPVPMPALPKAMIPAPLPDGSPVALPNIALTAAQSVFGLEKAYVVIHAGRWVDLAGNLHPAVDPPVDRQGRMQIRFDGPAGRAARYSFADVAQGKIKSSVFHNDVVIFGATAPHDPATDLRATPFGEMPRVEVTSNAISTLMNRSYFTLLATHVHDTYALVLLVGIISGACLMFFSGWRGLLVMIGLLIVYFLVSWGIFAAGGSLLPVLSGLLTILAAYIFSLLLFLGPLRPVSVAVSPTYVPPPPDVVN